jgi:ABC-type uncharacterized transport system auxiliary subunit
VLSGTPTTAGTFTFSLQVKDSQVPAKTTVKAFTVTVAPGALAVFTTTLANAVAGTPYSQTVVATGGTAPYTWAVATLPLGNALPAGLTLTAGGVLSGTPTLAGTFNFSLQVTDSKVPAPAATVVQAYTLVVAPAGIPVLQITTASPLAPYTLGNVYVPPALTVTGGTAPYTWAVAPASTLPAGLSLIGGALSGTPTTAGTFNFSLQVTDSQVPTVTNVKGFTLIVSPAGAAPLVINNNIVADGVVGTAYSQTLTATGGTLPYAWAVAPGGALPAGLTFTAGGVLAGTPTTAGAFNFNLQVTDSQVPAVTTVKFFAVTISPAVAPITPTGTIVINGGALATNNTTVTLTLTASPDVTQMQFSKDLGVTWVALETFVATRVASLKGTQGVNTMSVRFRNAAGVLSPMVTDSIIFDTVKPSGTIAVASPNPTTLATGTLALTATDNVGGSGATQMQFSTNNGGFFFPAEPIVATRTVSLPIIGVNNFTVRFIDAAGNVSGNFNTSITRSP